MSSSEVQVHQEGFLDESHLGHQFEDLKQQTESYTVGMWIFLATEILFFGALFAAYIVYRTAWPDTFSEASGHLNIWLGGLNTMVLLTSSLTMALAVRASQLGNWKQQLQLLTVTVLLACVFLVVKYFEYSEKIEKNLVPGLNFKWEGTSDPAHAQVFYFLYFVMTGLHGAHVVIGILLMFALMIRTKIFLKRKQPQDYVPVEMIGLYWHFVDIVWIFLYPLLYLIGGR